MEDRRESTKHPVSRGTSIDDLSKQFNAFSDNLKASGLTLSIRSVIPEWDGEIPHSIYSPYGKGLKKITLTLELVRKE